MDIWATMLWVFIAGAIITTGVIVSLYLKQEYKIRIRELTSTSTKIICDKRANVKKDKDKVEFLKVFFGKGGHNELPLPPPEAIDYDPKTRKKVVECYWSADLGYLYIEDGKEIAGFEPLTTKQRSMTINQLRKKEARKVTTWKENLPLIVGLTAIILLVAVILLFWGEFMQPFSEAVNRVEALLSKAQLCSTTGGTQVIN